MTTFSELKLIPAIQDSLRDLGYETPTPIQLQSIPPLLEGRDVLGCAQTGTGKTAAFSLPVLQHLHNRGSSRGKSPISALILTPTRELAAQIGESLNQYGKNLRSRHLVIFGGVNENPQIRELKKGIDILVATPGRLLDLCNRGFIDLGRVEFFVLDEADRMLDMGFVHDVKKVMVQLPSKRQNLLFSATMPQAIVKLAASFLRNPISVEVTPQATTVERIAQKVMFVEKGDKKRLLAQIVKNDSVERGIVFTRTKHGANRLVQDLAKVRIDAAAIHGNKSQAARNRALENFRSGSIALLVATDIASRGIDIDGVSHVFNYDLPNESESYVHRIGRTARAGKSGVAISFCTAEETAYLVDIQKLIGQSVPVDRDHEYHLEEAVPIPGKRYFPPKKEQRGGRPSGGRGNQGRRPSGSKSGASPRRGASASARTGKSDNSSGNTKPSRSRRRPAGAGPASSSSRSRGSDKSRGS